MIQAELLSGCLAKCFTVFSRKRLIRRTNTVGLEAAPWARNTKIKVTSVDKTADMICSLCILPEASEVVTVAADRPLVSMLDIIAPLLPVDKEAVLLWSEVAPSSRLKVTLELPAIELSLAVAVIAVSVLPPLSALQNSSALLICLLPFSTFVTQDLTTVASWLLSG
jgi:hypothetical protein